MNETLILIAIFSLLGFVIIGLLFEREGLDKQHKEKENKLLEENSRLIKAVIAKNANDYVMTASIDKVAPEEKAPVDPDLVPEEALSDEEFMSSIGKVLKAPAK